VVPWPNFQLARMLHEDRIRAAQARRPEWVYEASLAKRHEPRRMSRWVRVCIADALHRLAASIEPNASIVQLD
jgi:hypothetical protein